MYLPLAAQKAVRSAVFDFPQQVNSQRPSGILTRYGPSNKCAGKRSGAISLPQAYYNPTRVVYMQGCNPDRTKCTDLQGTEYGCALRSNQKNIKLMDNGSYCNNGIDIFCIT